MKNKLNLIASVLLITLAVASVVSAFGVGSPYWSSNPLTMARGDTVVVNLNLQNMVGDEDVDVKAELIEGSGIASLEDEGIIAVKAGTSNTMVPLVIKMPKRVESGEVMPVHVEFKTVTNNPSGISMGTGMTISFNVIAGDEVKSNTTRNIAIAVVVVLAIIIWVIKKKKKRK